MEEVLGITPKNMLKPDNMEVRAVKLTRPVSPETPSEILAKTLLDHPSTF